MAQNKSEESEAVFGLQCFWGAEVKFATVKGVISTKVGYTGGTTANPSYKDLSDHTEVVAVKFDPNIITYEELLDIFYKSHDPTFDTKAQYMSAIFYKNQQQKSLAEQSLKEAQKRFTQPIVTKILALKVFTNAENYHQKYFLRKNKSLLESLNLSDEQLIDSHIATRLNGFSAGFGSTEQFNEELNSFGISSENADHLRQSIKSGPNLGEC